MSKLCCWSINNRLMSWLYDVLWNQFYWREKMTKAVQKHVKRITRVCIDVYWHKKHWTIKSNFSDTINLRNGWLDRRWNFVSWEVTLTIEFAFFVCLYNKFRVIKPRTINHLHEDPFLSWNFKLQSDQNLCIIWTSIKHYLWSVDSLSNVGNLIIFKQYNINRFNHAT